MKEYNPIIDNFDKIKELNLLFDQKEKEINKRIYNSQTDERSRIIKTKSTKILNYNIEQVFEEMLMLSLKDMHPNLKRENFIENSYFYSSGKMSKIPIKILKNDLNDIVSIMWFDSQGVKFVKTLLFKKLNSQKTKIKYIDFVKGSKALFGLTDNHMRRLYTSKQLIAFKMQILNAEKSLTNDINEKDKISNKIEKLSKKMSNKY